MSVAVRLTTVVIFAALSGCGNDSSPSVGSDRSTVSSGKPNASTGEVAGSAGATPSKQPDYGAVAWQDRVDYDKWEPPLPPGQDGWPTEPPSRWPELQARLLLPQEVRPGETVDYVVVLRNVSDDAVDLRPCGGYRQQVLVVGAGMAAEPVRGGESTFRLNCDSAPILLPNESRRYMMRLVVPDVATGNEVLFTWGLLDNMPDYDSQEWIRLSEATEDVPPQSPSPDPSAAALEPCAAILFEGRSYLLTHRPDGARPGVGRPLGTAQATGCRPPIVEVYSVNEESKDEALTGREEDMALHSHAT